MKKTRTYSPYALEAARILGTEVARARRERRWTHKDLAARAGITPPTLRKVESGDPTVGLGTAFEVAALVGVRLFDVDANGLSEVATRSNDRLALLPQRVRKSEGAVKDDF
ncbi:MAG: helix-turn-helix transcriptional regulator [Actinomycetia bacterium]|nr:helix-turn-helix transcriptional regulator [Actinomycetes bacterium]